VVYTLHMPTDSSSTDRRKTSFSLSPRAMKALARAKFELFSRYDMQVNQGDIIEALLLKYTLDLDVLHGLLQQREGVTRSQ